MITSPASDGISGPEAATLANITYRQLDYWARKGWVTPSVEKSRGRHSRRIYSPEDVVQLAALGRFGTHGVDVGALGPKIGHLKLPPGDVVVVVDGSHAVSTVPISDLRGYLAALGGPFWLFDPRPLRARLEARQDPEAESKLAERRSA